MKDFTTLFLNYPDEAAYPIAKAILGETPIGATKSKLADLIIKTLHNEERMDALLNSIDKQKRTILTALSLFPQVTGKQLIDAVGLKIGNLEALSEISALQHQLIILSDEGKLCINPMLEDKIIPMLGYSTLFEEGTALKKLPGVSSEMLKTFIIALHGRKRTPVNSITPLFPSFDEKRMKKLTPLLVKALTKLEAVNQGVINYKRVDELVALPPEHIRALLMSVSSDLPLSYTSHLFTLLSHLGPLDARSLEILERLLGYEHNIPAVESLASLIEIWGYENTSDIDEQPLLDSDMTITYHGDGGSLYKIAEPVSFDRVRTWKLSKESVVRALDAQIPGEEVNRILDSCANSETAKSFVNLAEQQYKEISMIRGIIIKSDERIFRLITGIPELKAHIVEQLGPQVLLMNSSTYPVWTKLLKQATGFLPSLKDDTNAKTIQTQTPLSAVPAQSVAEIPQEPKKKFIPENRSTWPPYPVETKKIVASGLQYQAKLRIIKDYIKDPDTYFKVECEGQHYLLKPISLDKESDKEMCLTAEIIPSEKKRTFKISKLWSVEVKTYPLL